MSTKKAAALVLFAYLPLAAQTNRTLDPSIVISPTAPFVLPNGSSLPSTCIVGQIYFQTAAVAGLNLYECDSANVWTQQVSGSTGGGLTNPMTTVGDQIVGGTGGAPTRAPAGNQGFVWTSNGAGTQPTWQATTGSSANFTGTQTNSVQRTVQSKLGDIVSVEDFGAVSDGNADNATAIQNAINSLHSGQTLYFPCTSSPGSYKIGSPISFQSAIGIALRGPNTGCMIDYNSASSNAYAVSFVGAENITVEDLRFRSLYGTAPQTMFVLGRAAQNTQSGAHKFINVQVDGNVAKALVYSIGSEECSWINPTFILNGGGALYDFYTSIADDLSVGAGLAPGSNLSLWLIGFHIMDLEPAANINTTHSLVVDASGGTSGGDHHYNDGYFASANGTAITFEDTEGSGGIARFSTEISDIRFENGVQFLYLSGVSGTAINGLTIRNNRIDTYSGGLYVVNSASGVNAQYFTMEGNTAVQSETSVFNNLSNSYVNESFTVTINGTSTNNVLINKGTGAIVIPALKSNTGSRYLCINSSGQLSSSASSCPSGS